MHIVNIMLAPGKGGLQQSFVDYCEAMALSGHLVTAIISSNKWIEAQLEEKHIPFRHLNNLGPWDIRAKIKLRRMLNSLHADLIMTHGNRAFLFSSFAAEKKIPCVAVAHNYRTKYFNTADKIFIVNTDLKEHLVQQGILPSKIVYIPNTTRIPKQEERPSSFRKPIVIGAMGRLSQEKGFDIFIEALALLEKRGIDFQAKLAGDGPEEAILRQKVKTLKLEDKIEFLGWIKDQTTFFNSLDIFCLPSLQEAFGIVILEAFAHKVPVVVTDTKGPQTIVNPGKDAILVKKGSAEALAEGVMKLINHPEQALHYREAGYRKVIQEYSFEVFKERVQKALKEFGEAKN